MLKNKDKDLENTLKILNMVYCKEADMELSLTVLEKMQDIYRSVLELDEDTRIERTPYWDYVILGMCYTYNKIASEYIDEDSNGIRRMMIIDSFYTYWASIKHMDINKWDVGCLLDNKYSLPKWEPGSLQYPKHEIEECIRPRFEYITNLINRLKEEEEVAYEQSKDNV